MAPSIVVIVTTNYSCPNLVLVATITSLLPSCVFQSRLLVSWLVCSSEDCTSHETLSSEQRKKPVCPFAIVGKKSWKKIDKVRECVGLMGTAIQYASCIYRLKSTQAFPKICPRCTSWLDLDLIIIFIQGVSLFVNAERKCQQWPGGPSKTQSNLGMVLPWPKKLRQAHKPNIGASMLDRSRACATCARLSQFFWPGIQ